MRMTVPPRKKTLLPHLRVTEVAATYVKKVTMVHEILVTGTLVSTVLLSRSPYVK